MLANTLNDILCGRLKVKHNKVRVGLYERYVKSVTVSDVLPVLISENRRLQTERQPLK